MAYENSTATSIADLFSRLSTFAVANGWTEDYAASDRLFLTKGSVSVAFRWASSGPTGAGIYQHTAFVNSSTDPGNHTNDSGVGAIGSTNAAIAAGRFCSINNAGVQYWFFEDDDGTDIKVVVENNGVGGKDFRHFGFGSIDKLGTWTGGAYAYGQKDDANPAVNTAFDEDHSILLDGLAGSATPAAMRAFAATLHVESLPGQTASGKWGLVWAGGLANTGTDRGGTARENVQGGYRGGPAAREFGRFGGVVGSGLVPGYPIGCWYHDRGTTSRWHPLGYMKNVFGFNVKNYLGAEEIVIGSDTYVVFPARHKLSVASNLASQNMGMIYKKVV